LNRRVKNGRKVSVLVALAAILLPIPNIAASATEFRAFELKKAGLYPELEKRFGKKATYTAEEVLSLEQPKPATFTAEDVKTHFEVIQKLDPAKAHLYDQLVHRFGKKSTYSADEVTAIEVPRVPTKGSLNFPPSATVDTFSAEVVRQHFALLRSSNPKTKASMEILEKKYPGQTRYTAAQIRDVEKNGEEVTSVGARPKTPVVFVAEQQASMAQPQLLSGWKTPLVRHDWSDVVIAEDPSQRSEAVKTKTDDLVGATFGYTHNAQASSDTWTTVGALIWPWVYERPVTRSLIPPYAVLAPSISVNRIATSGDPKGEVDQVFYRLGIYAEWFEPFGHFMDLLQVRAAPVFGTNTGHEARMPAFEVDVEPSWLFNNARGEECKYKIGFKNIIWPKEPLLDDLSDQSVVDYQVRTWLHVEGGDVQNTGNSFAAVPGSFLRVGPTAQLRINTFFPVPLLTKGLSFTAQYSYLPGIEGPKGHDSLLKLVAALTLLSDKANHQKVTLNADYTRGGLNFTKQDVDTFMIGLGVLF
jgi:hypothetical protein